ncbi:hypothetical protein [Domibacillus indicus]|uniref:hypothetical protein n=1 Tax=Domibacillus indicus TaxID=1437523 RepID=UPI001E3EF69F|nr:hypothetical protein [Domibacillus indicus]
MNDEGDIVKKQKDEWQKRKEDENGCQEKIGVNPILTGASAFNGNAFSCSGKYESIL